MKMALMTTSIAIVLMQASYANALSNCFYQHLGIGDGEVYQPGFDGSYLGDTHTVQAQGNGWVIASWMDQSTELEYTIKAIDDTPAQVCRIEAKAENPLSHHWLFNTINQAKGP